MVGAEAQETETQPWAPPKRSLNARERAGGSPPFLDLKNGAEGASGLRRSLDG